METARMTIRSPVVNNSILLGSPGEIPNRIYGVEEQLTPLLGANAIQHMGLIEVKKENFRQVASVNTETTPRKTAEKFIVFNDLFRPVQRRHCDI